VEGFTKRRRHLPHWESPGSEYFITFELNEKSICDLTTDEIGSVIFNHINEQENKSFIPLDFTIMPSHVHMIIKVTQEGNKSESLAFIMKRIKGHTAYLINKFLNRKGKFWRVESYDRIIRNIDGYKRFSKYIYENPIKANLLDRGENWKWWRHHGTT
jgi:REP element-mobilizing transposase RayT